MKVVEEIRSDADAMDAINDPNAGWAGYVAEVLEDVAAVVEDWEERAERLGYLEGVVYKQCASEMRRLMSTEVGRLSRIMSMLSERVAEEASRFYLDERKGEG